MGKLREALAAHDARKKERLAPEILATMDRCTEELKASGIEQRALRAGSTMPDFALPNQHGQLKRLSDYLASAPVVLNIYRGGWCPYCNLEMKALHDALPEIEKRGAVLVGLAPEAQDKARASAEGNGLAIDILSDTGNRVAEQLGLAFELPEALRPIYQGLGIDIPDYNGDNTFKLPIPATYIVGRNRVIAFDFVNADYTRRLEPSDIVAKLDELRLS